MINLRIQHSNCLWHLFDLSYSMYIESISGIVAIQCVLSDSLYLHTLPTSKLHQQNRFFIVGSWPRHSCL